MIEIDLIKQQAIDADLEAILKINFTGNLAWDLKTNTTIFFVTDEAKDFRFFTGNCESIVNVVVQLSYCVFHNLF